LVVAELGPPTTGKGDREAMTPTDNDATAADRKMPATTQPSAPTTAERSDNAPVLVTIYSSAVCPYCDAAKRLMDSLGVGYDEVLLDDKPELRQRLSDDNRGFRTVPMIFAGDELLGGFQDVMALHGRGELLPRLGR
jgi:glutaredoxin 3